MKKLCAWLLALLLLSGAALAEGSWILGEEARAWINNEAGKKITFTIPAGARYTVQDTMESEGKRYVRVAHDFPNPVSGEGWILESATKNSTPTEFFAPVDVGVVLCEALSVREAPETSAKRLAYVRYGQAVRVDTQQEGWLYVRFGDVQGWVLADYVMVNPKYYTTPTQTPAYAYGSRQTKRVGLLDGGTTLVVIAELDHYYVVSLRGGSAFIAK